MPVLFGRPGTFLERTSSMVKAKADEMKLMQGAVLIVADGARARLFAVDDRDQARRLHEHADLVNPEGELLEREVFADSRNGRANGSSTSRVGHTFDDRRQRNRDEGERRFARAIGKAAWELVGTVGAVQLVVLASPRFLGQLRPELRRIVPSRFPVVELSETLAGQTTPRIEELLTRQGMLAPRLPPERVFRPRGQTTAAH
jgi:protein required for attachment to host cells